MFDWKNLFHEFEQSRKPNGDAVAQLALDNFIEMRDLVADPKFILKNKISQKLAILFPEKWNTQYKYANLHASILVTYRFGRLYYWPQQSRLEGYRNAECNTHGLCVW